MFDYSPKEHDVPRVSSLPRVTPEQAGDLKAPWRDTALCKDYSQTSDTPGDFTAEYDAEALERARTLCRACPTSTSAMCLASALVDPDRAQGVRGGFYFVMGGLDAKSKEFLRKRYRVRSRVLPSAH